MAKNILGLPVAAPNVSGHVLLGFKSVKEVIYTAQLKFLLKVLKLCDTRWSKDALLAHLHGGWKSPYIEYIARVRREVGLGSGPLTVRLINLGVSHHFLNILNEKLYRMRLPVGHSVTKLRVWRHVGECERSKELSAWLVGQAQLGHKAPRKGYPRLRYCPVCSGGRRDIRPVLLTDRHVLQVCPAVTGDRGELRITAFMAACRARGFSHQKAFSAYLCGLSEELTEVGRPELLARGGALLELRLRWLGMWRV